MLLPRICISDTPIEAWNLIPALNRWMVDGGHGVKGEVDRLVQMIRGSRDKEALVDLLKERDENYVPGARYSSRKVFVYELKFGGLRQYIPVSNIVDIEKEGSAFLEAFRYCDWVPLEDPIPLDGWNLKFNESYGSNYGDISNFMEKTFKDTGEYLMFWLSPSFSNAVKDYDGAATHTPWDVDFSFEAMVSDGNRYIHTDSAFVSARLGSILGSYNREEGRVLCEGIFKGRFTREFGSDKVIFEVKDDICASVKPPKTYDWPILQSGSIGVEPEALRKMGGVAIAGKPKLSYGDLMAAAVFPNLSARCPKIDYSTTLKNLVDLFKTGNPQSLGGFGWVSFSG